MLYILYSIIIYPITLIIDFFFFFSMKLFKEPGISIFIINLVISFLCLPLYLSAEKKQQAQREIETNLRRKVSKIKSVFKGDEQYMILSAYYRQNHYHPVYALRNSFSLFVQIPFFIAAYSYISHLEFIKGASFLFIKDLGSPDRLFFSLNILPIIMTLINCLSGFVYAKNLAIKDKIQIYGISFIFLLLLYNSPSGLVIYWILNNIFSLVKNIYIKSRLKYKKTFLSVFFSLVCVFMVAFISFTMVANTKLRLLLSFVFFLFAFFPWIIFAINRRFPDLIDIISPGKNRSIIFVLTMTLIVFIAGVLIPSFLIGASPQEFSFIDSFSSPFPFLFNSFLQATGLFLLWPSFFYFLVSERTKKYFNLMSLILAGIIILNSFVFPGNYGFISINMVYDGVINHSGREILINILAILGIIFFIPFLLKFQKQKIVAPILVITIFVTTVISIHNFFIIRSEYYKVYNVISVTPPQASTDVTGEIKPIFKLSREGKNIIVIMLDRANSPFVPYIFDEKPELSNSFSGFVYYPNTVSFGQNTRSGSSALFGGYEYAPFEMNKITDKTNMAKHNEALLLMPAIFSKEGYSVTVGDLPYTNYYDFFDPSIYAPYSGVSALTTQDAYTQLWLDENNIDLPKTSERLNRNILLYSIFKCSPLLFRYYLYYDGDWCSLVSIGDLLSWLGWYSSLDFLPRLTSIDSGNCNNCVILDNMITHISVFLQAPDYIPSLKINISGSSPFNSIPAYHVNAAALFRLGEYFDYLKRENVYDNTRIILVADHGNRNNFIGKFATGIPINLDAVNPLLMVKDFNASGELKTDNSFMSNADVPFIATKDIISNPINPFTGKSLDINFKNDLLYIAFSLGAHLEGANESKLPLDPAKDYYVKENIFVPSNWIKADTIK